MNRAVPVERPAREHHPDDPERGIDWEKSDEIHMRPAYDLGQMHLVKEKRRVERRGTEERWDQEPKERMPVRFAAGLLEALHACAGATLSHGLRGALFAQKTYQHWSAQKGHHARDDPKPSPIDDPHQSDKADRQQRFAQSKSKSRNRERPSLCGHKPVRDRHNSDVAAHALAENRKAKMATGKNATMGFNDIRKQAAARPSRSRDPTV